MTSEKNHNVDKAELAGKVAALGLNRRLAGRVVEEVFSQMRQALLRGEDIHLVGFGAFHFKVRRARRGRNPRTGAPVDIPAKRVIVFRPGQALKKLVRD
jgi:nucleoid DNA-binding protein